MELALKDNDFWLGYLAGQTENGENIGQVPDAEKNLEKVTVASLKKAAGRYFQGNNRLLFQLLPEQ